MPSKPVPKEKRSFTLSHPSVSYLERLRKRQKAASVSEVLDNLINEARERDKPVSIEDKIAAYYSNRPATDDAEDEQWGLFVESQLAARD
jgi:hypothetical protein